MAADGPVYTGWIKNANNIYKRMKSYEEHIYEY